MQHLLTEPFSLRSQPLSTRHYGRNHHNMHPQRIRPPNHPDQKQLQTCEAATACQWSLLARRFVLNWLPHAHKQKRLRKSWCESDLCCTAAGSRTLTKNEVALATWQSVRARWLCSIHKELVQIRSVFNWLLHAHKGEKLRTELERMRSLKLDEIVSRKPAVYTSRSCTTESRTKC